MSYTKNEMKSIISIGEDIIAYALRNEPAELYIDIVGMDTSIYDYVKEELIGSNTKIVPVYAVSKSDGVAFRKMKTNENYR